MILKRLRLLLLCCCPLSCVVTTDKVEGLACWDLDGDGIEAQEEDTNGDGAWNSLDCAGPRGDTGADGADGQPGTKGADGTDGLPGSDGQDGMDGLPGQDGANGVSPFVGPNPNDGSIYYDGGSVGIGTATPASILHVRSSSPDNNGQLTLENDVGTQSNLYTARSTVVHANATVLENAGQAAVLLNPAGGNVGIGTISPVATLDVDGTARLAKYSAEPFPCDVQHDGAIALTVKHRMCVCDGTSWVLVHDGLPCSWAADPLTEATYATSAVFRGQSSMTVSGNLMALVPGSSDGYAAGKSICNTQLNSPSAHMCTAEEVARSAAIGISVPNGWYIAATYSHYMPLDRHVTDCAGFTTSALNIMGHGWAAGPNVYSCSLVLPVLCCDR